MSVTTELGKGWLQGSFPSGMILGLSTLTANLWDKLEQWNGP